MGRLFWKFLFFFWLAQLVTSIGVGVAIWVSHPEHGQPPAAMQHGMGPPPPVPFPGTDFRPPLPHPGGWPPHDPSLNPLLLPLFAGSLVSLVFAALLAWYFARPIRSLRSAFESVAGGKLETRIGGAMRGRRDELADLGKDFDRMASRLQGLLDSQRRLLHDVSHELRSPLARLQAAADLMQQQPERAGEFIERIERDMGRMDKLVGELLTLARLDAGMTGSLAEEVDLHEVVAQIAVDAQFEADAKGCTVDIDLPEHVEVVGSQELLYRALENVVRNAVRHSPAGGRIAITLRREGARWLLTIADQGDGVREGDLKKIFEPFFRSGSGSGYASGYGLGLAITLRIVHAHGGTISAANRPEGGLLITIALPAGPDNSL